MKCSSVASVQGVSPSRVCRRSVFLCPICFHPTVSLNQNVGSRHLRGPDSGDNRTQEQNCTCTEVLLLSENYTEEGSPSETSPSDRPVGNHPLPKISYWWKNEERATFETKKPKRRKQRDSSVVVLLRDSHSSAASYFSHCSRLPWLQLRAPQLRVPSASLTHRPHPTTPPPFCQSK